MLPKKEKHGKGFFSFLHKNKKKDKDDSKTSSPLEEEVGNSNSAELVKTSTSEEQELTPNKLSEEKKVRSRTILLIGSTGKGKSTLANVLVNKVSKDGQFEDYREVFKESEASISGTREIQKENFAESGVNYLTIDTVGIGDTRLKREEVLDKLAEAVY